jgi:hypothetical protein
MADTGVVVLVGCPFGDGWVGKDSSAVVASVGTRCRRVVRGGLDWPFASMALRSSIARLGAGPQVSPSIGGHRPDTPPVFARAMSPWYSPKPCPRGVRPSRVMLSPPMSLMSWCRHPCHAVAPIGGQRPRRPEQPGRGGGRGKAAWASFGAPSGLDVEGWFSRVRAWPE